MTTVVVPYAEVERAIGVWADQSELLHGAAGTIDEGDVGCLGPRVAPAATRFLEEWTGAVDGLETTAGDHAEALRGVRVNAIVADAVVSGDLAGLLPYAGPR